MCVSMSMCVNVCVMVTFRVQQLGETQVLLGQVEGILQVVVGVGLLQLIEVDQVGSEEDQRGKRSLNADNPSE